MATSLDPKQAVSFEEFLISQVVQHETLTRFFIENGKGTFVRSVPGYMGGW